MGMSVGESKGSAMAEMNIVPLIDILLVLLIIFMVITPLTPKGLEAQIPQPNRDAIEPTPRGETVVVQVMAGPKNDESMLKINSEDTTWENFGTRMEQIFKERAEKVAFVKGDNDVMFTDVARAIDIMRGAGIDKVGLITAKREATP
jgi:biopolymer transport protein TolR